MNASFKPLPGADVAGDVDDEEWRGHRRIRGGRSQNGGRIGDQLTIVKLRGVARLGGAWLCAKLIGRVQRYRTRVVFASLGVPLRSKLGHQGEHGPKHLRGPHFPSFTYYGYTLIELLVTIAVISVLASLTFATLGMGMRRAKSVQCTSNLRQLGIAVRLYASDNAGHLPIVAAFRGAYTSPSATPPAIQGSSGICVGTGIGVRG
jgi:prepilin-type N-terminal cleavage/methylation domain-containing protein